jgi:uncharacterized membrane protein (UPF0127 family)
MKRKSALATCLALLLVGAACAQAAKEFQPAQLRDFPRGTLEIQRGGGKDTLRIWIADTEARQEQGLMWIRDMPGDYGMVFPLRPPRLMYMWMKNTYMSLDMLFYDEQGRIAHIVEGAKPLSEEIIESRVVSAGVVELLAGEVARRHIKVGDRVTVRGGGD